MSIIKKQPISLQALWITEVNELKVVLSRNTVHKIVTKPCNISDLPFQKLINLHILLMEILWETETKIESSINMNKRGFVYHYSAS